MYRCVTKSCDENIDFNLNSHQDVILHGREKEFLFKPRILLSCGHSICEKCIFTAVTSRQEEFIRCEDCGQTTTFSAQTIQTIRVNRPQVKPSVRWNEGCEDDLVYEAFSIGAAFNSGRISISATPCVDLDETIFESSILPNHSYRNEPEVISIHDRVSNASESFKSIIKDGISMYSACGTSLKILFDTKTALNKQFVQTKEAIRKRFHILHGLLQLEEANLIRDLVKSKENALKSIQGKEKAIDSARNHLKSIILRSPQYAHLQSNNPVKNEVDQCRSKPLRIDSLPELQNHLSSLSKPHDDLQQSIKKLADFRKVIRFDVNISFSPLISSNQSATNVPTLVESPATRKKSRPKALSYVNYLRSQLVTIHDVKDSGFFSAHLPSDEIVATSLAKALLKWCDIYRHPPSVTRVKPKSDVIVWHDQKSLWVRAKLKRFIEKPQQTDKENFCLLESKLTSTKVEVTLVDYADEVYETGFENLRESCSQLTDPTTYPPLLKVWKCRLKNIHSLSSNLRGGVLRFCPSGIKVRLLILSEPIDGYYEVDVAHDIRDLVNPQPTLIEYLIYCNLAKLKDPLQQLPYPSASIVLRYREAQLFVNDEVRSVDITSIRNPSYFYVVDATKREEIESIEKKINELYSSHNMSIALRLYFPRHWIPCAARCELFWDKKKKRGKMFHRGYIIPPKEDVPRGMLEFFTIDYGETVEVPLSEIRILPDCYVTALPRTAINCSLHDIAPVDSRNWSQNAIAAFTEFFQATDTPTAITVKSREEKKLSVVVNLHAITANYPDGNINEILIQDGYAIKKSQVAPLVDLSRDTNPTPSTSNGHRANGNRMDFNCYSLIQDFARKSKKHKLNRIDSLIPIKITAFVSPQSFYIQINTPEVQTDIDNYMKRLSEEYENVDTDRVPVGQMQGFDVGDLCIYLYERENGYDTYWRRGRIMTFLGRQNQKPTENSVDPRQMKQVSPDSAYVIRDRDYGLTVTVKRKHMLVMPPSSPYRKDGEKCLQVYMPDIKHTAKDDWTKDAIDFCNLELRKHHDKLFIQIEDKLTQDQPDKLGVDVIYLAVEIHDACLPSEEHYYSLRYQLLDSKHALLAREDLVFEKEIKIEDDSVYTDLRIPFSARDDSLLSSLRSAYYTDNQPIDGIKYLEAKIPEVNEFNAICTYVDDGPFIWFRLREEGPNESSIGTVNRKIMQKIMTQERLVPFKGSAEIGRACTVFNNFSWHRAEIQSTAGNKIIVHHVDTGESKAYFIDKISSEVFCDGVPKLALGGRLDKCTPFVERRSDAHILLKKFLEENLVGKKIRVKWENFGSTRKMAISVSLEEGRDLKSILLNKDLVRESSSVSEDLPQYIRATLELMEKSEFSFLNHQFVMDKLYYIVIGHFVKENYMYVQLNPFKKLSCPEEHEVNGLYEKYDFDMQSINANVSSFSKALDFNVGNSCCAPYENEWFRGIVSAVIIPKKRYEVFFVDWGNSEICDIENMRILPDSFGLSGNPIFGFYVRLSNIRPARRGVWTQRLYDMMKQMIDQNTNSVEFMIKFKSDTMPFDVELWTAGSNNQPDSLFFQDMIDGGFLETI